ncbi:16S rRNA (cytosine(1402)-N(4))-methyltransferase RsmH [Helicobacter aurati]|nr:16S rRNA (cytosine(1402)-N(4))-methyltransferase RsmH [Helicobacter aurati]
MVFGLDFGTKRIGVAKLVGEIALPLPPIIRTNKHQASKELARILQEHSIHQKNEKEILLVVGLPNTDSTLSDSSHITKNQVLRFLNLIEFNGKIVFVNESNSSKEAQERLQHRGYKARRQARKNGQIDSLSACIILERYRDSLLNKTQVTQEIAHFPSTQEQPINLSLSSISQDNPLDSTQFEVHVPVLLQEVLHTFDSVFSEMQLSYPSKIANDNLSLSSCNAQHSFVDSMQSNINKQTIQQFIADSTSCIIDCTLGFGGMSSALLSRYQDISIIGIDRDSEAINANQSLQETFPNRIYLHQGDFASALPEILEICDLYPNKFKGILADIGVSSHQFDCTNRGFNFQATELDMRMDTTQSLHAAQILHSYSGYDLERIFRDYGEIASYKKLASLIVSARQKGRITGEVLQNIALKLSCKKRIHPATLIYQALRIEVNDELGQLAKLLESCSKIRKAIVCLISFHSLEDRMIKESMKKWAKSCICAEDSMKCECGNNHAKGVILYKKPLVASHEEIRNNPRSRSAKLRAFYFF